jgi:hypothetical protein
MKKPEALIELLDELEPDDDAVRPGEGAKMIIHTPKGPLELNENECMALLQSEKTVDRMFAALDSPADSWVDLVGLTLNGAVFERLEDLFDSVEAL